MVFVSSIVTIQVHHWTTDSCRQSRLVFCSDSVAEY